MDSDGCLDCKKPLVLATKDVVEHRKAICNACPKRMASFCRICGCVIPAKIRLEMSMCPIGKW